MPSIGPRKEHRPGQAKPLAYLLGALLVVGLLGLNVLYSAQTVALDIDFYETGWVALDVPSKVEMTLQELTRAGESLRDYFLGRIDTPQIETEIRGIARPLYNQKELDHLVDVRELFAKGFVAQKVCWLVALSSIAYFALGPNRSLPSLGKALAISGATGIGALALLAIPAAMNFTDWWTKFHLLSFTNDLWLLDPRTDWLINMFPEGFFFRAVRAIGLRSLTVSTLLLAAGLLIRHLASDHRH